VKRITAALTLALFAAAGGVVLGSSLQSAADASAIQDAFDRGVARGVEYEQWFCQNEVVV
jgi:hypothetical protein